MVDVFDKKTRSYVMSKIRAKNTGPEIVLRKALIGLHLRYQPKGIVGNPDFASKKYKIAIFVDGDFWHGWFWKESGIPSKKFWKEKIKGNIKRDKIINRKLKKLGWRVIRLWEHQVNKKMEKCIRKVQREFDKNVDI